MEKLKISSRSRSLDVAQVLMFFSEVIEGCLRHFLLGISEEEKKYLLYCVVIGSAPIGMEFSGELSYFISGVHLVHGVLSDGNDVRYGLLVWSIGVGPSEFVKSLNLPNSLSGRIDVDEWLCFLC